MAGVFESHSSACPSLPPPHLRPQVIDKTLYASLYGNEDSIGICTLLTLDNVFLGLFACLYALVTVQGWVAMVKAVVYVRHARTFAPIALQVII